MKSFGVREEVTGHVPASPYKVEGFKLRHLPPRSGATVTEDSHDFSWGEMTRLPQPRRSKGTIFRFSTAISTLVLWPPIFFIVVFIIGHACLGF